MNKQNTQEHEILAAVEQAIDAGLDRKIYRRRTKWAKYEKALRRLLEEGLCLRAAIKVLVDCGHLKEEDQDRLWDSFRRRV